MKNTHKDQNLKKKGKKLQKKVSGVGEEARSPNKKEAEKDWHFYLYFRYFLMMAIHFKN